MKGVYNTGHGRGDVLRESDSYLITMSPMGGFHIRRRIKCNRIGQGFGSAKDAVAYPVRNGRMPDLAPWPKILTTATQRPVPTEAAPGHRHWCPSIPKGHERITIFRPG